MQRKNVLALYTASNAYLLRADDAATRAAWMYVAHLHIY